MNRLINIATVSTMAIAAALAVGPASAQAQSSNITCGATVTTDTKLTSDLLNCPDNGLVIGADDITLDLNGHTIRGDGVGSCPGDAVCDVGIANATGHNDVTIKGGAVQGFDVGVIIIGATEDHLERISSANNSSFGVIIGESTESRIDHNSSVGDGTSGIVMFDSSDMRLDHNSVTGAHGYAIPVFDSSHNRFEHNVLTSDQHGILLESCDQNTVQDNEIRGNRRRPSIEVDHSSDNQVLKNSLTDPGDGILFRVRRTQVTDNVGHRTRLLRVHRGRWLRILLDGARDNVLQRKLSQRR